MRNRILGYSSSLFYERRGVPRGEQPLGKQQFETMIQSLGKTIGDNPAVALGVALSIGVVLGWLMKRR